MIERQRECRHRHVMRWTLHDTNTGKDAPIWGCEQCDLEFIPKPDARDDLAHRLDTGDHA